MGCCFGSGTAVVVLKDQASTTPVRNRKCTDVAFLLVFIVALVATGFFVIRHAVESSDPERYVYGVDSFGNVCGRQNNKKIFRPSVENGSFVNNSGLDRSSHTYELNFALSDFRGLSDAVLGKTSHYPAVLCVQECPNVSTSCEELMRLNNYSVDSEGLTERICPLPEGFVVAHVAILNRCIPEQLSALGRGLEQALVAAIGVWSSKSRTNGTDEKVIDAASLAHNLIQSLSQNSTTLMYIFLIATGTSLLVTILIQLIARVLVVIIMLLAAFGTGAATAWLWYSYAISQGIIPASAAMDMWTNLISSGQEMLGNQANETGNLSLATANLSDILTMQKLNQSRFLLPVAIGATVFTIIGWALLMWSRKSLWLTVQLFDEASLAIFSNPAALLQPLQTTVWLIASLLAFLVGTAYLFTDQVPYADENGIVVFVDRSFLQSGRFLFPFFLFSSLWMFQFIFGCQEVILASVVSLWFFSRSEKNRKCDCKLTATCKSLADLLKYNLGTVAFGSLIVAVVQFARIILAYLQKKLNNSTNKTAQFCLKCMQCCLACFEKVLKYVNRNAYICVAMYGEGFCSSGRRALGLLISNAHHVMAINCMSNFCLLLGKIFVVALVGAIAWMWIPGTDVSDVRFFFPVTICCVGTFFIASCFLSVFVIAIDTIFLCFCDDMQRNDGVDRPYYSSKRLLSILSEGNKGTEEEKESGA